MVGMPLDPREFRIVLNRLLADRTTLRKVLTIVSITLVIEGLFAVFLFSYTGILFGLASLLVGSFLYVSLRRESECEATTPQTTGVRIANLVFRFVGGKFPTILIGTVIVASVMVYNAALSPNPEFGDLDTLCIAFGVAIILFPILRIRYEFESTFAVYFIGFVVIFLVIPLATANVLGTGETSSAGGWYVHYMLAAPFSAILNLIGIPSSSVGSLVTIQFQDGSLHTLSISAYCAGLYSFSIFLSAFVAFILVFEKICFRLQVLILARGVLAAYLGNLLRMAVIGVVGFYEGIEALRWAHQNVGWMIFLAWSATFWYVTLRLLSRADRSALSKVEAN